MPPIQFPGFGFQVEVQRELFKGFPVRWYGLCIALGFLLAVIYALRRAKRFGIKEDNLINMLFVVVPMAIVGARLYYVAFDWNALTAGSSGLGDTLLRIVRIWDGGLAIYGAVIFAVLGAWLYCRKAKVNTLAMFDLGALGLLIGQGVGRWGNFFNQEVYGTTTDLPWRMGIDKSQELNLGHWTYVHPLFLYESLWCILGLILLHFLSKRRKYNGQIFLGYIAWYGLGRGLLEQFFREPSESLRLFGGSTGIRVSALLSAILVVFGVVMLLINWKRPHDPALVAGLPDEPEGAEAPATSDEQQATGEADRIEPTPDADKPDEDDPLDGFVAADDAEPEPKAESKPTTKTKPKPKAKSNTKPEPISELTDEPPSPDDEATPEEPAEGDDHGDTD